MKRVQVLKAGAWGLVGLLLEASAGAQPVTELFDRVELNWSAMRVRFYGEASASLSESSFDNAEKIATEEGLLYALQSIPRIRSEKGLQQAEDARIAAELTKQTYVVNTTYFADGRVRVDLEGNLPKALERQELSFERDEPQAVASEATAIVFTVSDRSTPLLTPTIVSSRGDVLYSPSQVARSAYKKNMSGRWFFQKSIELKNFAGAAPVIVEASSQGDKLVVDGEQWQKIAAEHPRLLEEARLAFAITPLPKAKGSSRQ